MAVDAVLGPGGVQRPVHLESLHPERTDHTLGGQIADMPIRGEAGVVRHQRLLVDGLGPLEGRFDDDDVSWTNRVRFRFGRHVTRTCGGTEQDKVLKEHAEPGFARDGRSRTTCQFEFEQDCHATTRAVIGQLPPPISSTATGSGGQTFDDRLTGF